ncbi:MAG: serine hydroxymethyltransferase [Eubacteriaceae bacterium]|jgi:glycine hydroxymethyltransferase|nr:serine hydroxymethyltransferase [Eubacteriaceae bacterium]
MEMLKETDDKIFNLIDEELVRQQTHLELIASENFVSEAVMEAMGSCLTNKYAEGIPGSRYYGGCEVVDQVETIAIERAKKLFGAEYANVQAHSGVQANTAVYFALLEPGDKVLGMRLDQGGHLTHGSKVNLSGKYFNFISYGVDPETEHIDYDEMERLIVEEKPKLVVAGASAYPREIKFDKIGELCQKHNVLYMVDMAHIAGLVAAGMHQNPVPYADVVTTTTHKTLRGPRGGLILCKKELGPKIDKAVFPGTQGGPLMHIVAAKAVALKEALSPEYKTYQEQVVKNARKLAESLTKKGIRIVSGGTDNHLLLMDVGSIGMTGVEADELLSEVNITVNKNAIPNDPQPPKITSGIRLGTPAVTTRGLMEKDMEVLADAIAMTLIDKKKEEAKALVKSLTDQYPLYNRLSCKRVS